MELEIELPVFQLTDEQEELSEMGIEVDVSLNPVKNITFYSVYNIQPLSSGVSLIMSGSDYFYVKLDILTLKSRIRKQKYLFKSMN